MTSNVEIIFRKIIAKSFTDLGLQDEDLYTEDIESAEQIVWWKSMISEEEMEDYRMGPKIVLLFAILRQCESIGDKL